MAQSRSPLFSSGASTKIHDVAYTGDYSDLTNTPDLNSITASSASLSGNLAAATGGFTGNATVGGDLVVSGEATATDFVTTSDARVKTDIETLQGALDMVGELRGVRYTQTQTQRRQVGVIAQEVEAVLPEVVSQGEEFKAVAYGNIVGVLIEAIKELKEKVETLEREAHMVS